MELDCKRKKNLLSLGTLYVRQLCDETMKQTFNILINTRDIILLEDKGNFSLKILHYGSTLLKYLLIRNYFPIFICPIITQRFKNKHYIYFGIDTISNERKSEDVYSLNPCC